MPDFSDGNMWLDAPEAPESEESRVYRRRLAERAREAGGGLGSTPPQLTPEEIEMRLRRQRILGCYNDAKSFLDPACGK